MSQTITVDTVKEELLAIVFRQLDDPNGHHQAAVQGLFQAAGELLAHMTEPHEAAAFLRREAGRIENMAISPTTERTQ